MAPRDERFGEMMRQVLAANPFYRSKYAGLDLDPGRPPGLEALPRLPLTHKEELTEDQRANPPFGSNLTFAPERYTRVHQTSGTTATPIRWLDTRGSWEWWLECWETVYGAAGVGPGDRIFVAFSFGPFIGFWSAFEAGQRLGAMVVPGGGLSTTQRLETLLETGCTVVVSTPTYALRLAEVAREEGVDLAASDVQVTLHAGEPGASIPNVKARLESLWGARCFDHAGATEVGAWGFTCGAGDAMHVNEVEFVAEVLAADGETPAEPDDDGVLEGELVLTNLGRVGSPVIRYRSGDLVRLARRRCECGLEGAVLPGGVLGRADRMLVVRGINVFPSALEDLVREVPEIGEFEVRLDREREMSELVLRVEVEGEDPSAATATLARLIHRRLNLRPRVEVAPAGSLPRYELKARRFKL